jgi:hypothetical protein
MEFMVHGHYKTPTKETTGGCTLISFFLFHSLLGSVIEHVGHRRKENTKKWQS